MGEDAYLGGSRPGMVGTLREALGIKAPREDSLTDFDVGELDVDYSQLENPQNQEELAQAAYYGLKGMLGRASTEPSTDEKLQYLAGFGAQQDHMQSADDVIRFVLSLDGNATASPHSLVSRLFAAAQRAKAYAARMKRRQ